MENDDVIHEYTDKYPKIDAKYKAMFGLPEKSLLLLRKQLYDLYSKSNATFRNIVKPKSLHTIISDLFIKDYYPIISKTYNTNEHTIAIIMGTIGFNMNIPPKLEKLLYTDTDDIDLKIYTTQLHYDKRKNKPQNVKQVLSLFKYIVLTLFMYLKQVIGEIIEFSKTIFSKNENEKTLPTLKPTSKSTKKTKKNNRTQNTTKSMNKSKSMTTSPLNQHKLINAKQKNFGFLNSVRIYIQIKQSIGINREEINDKIDITKLSYDATYNLLSNKLNDVDLLITSKIKYWMKYSTKLGKKPKFLNTFTFSDTKIYYPNLAENSTFYTQYLLNYKYMNRPDYATTPVTTPATTPASISNLSLDTLYAKNISISDIIKFKHCGIKNYNCNYIAVNSLKIDLILMLQYAEFINDEVYDQDTHTAKNHSNTKIIVPISSLFKYIKYLTKYLKLYIIIKYYNKTLNKDYTNATIKFIQTINKIITTTTIEPENEPINIQYKKTINKLHQDFFIKQTLFPEYSILKEVVDEYNYIKQYINKSRFLFKDEFEKFKKTNNNMCDSVNLLHILNLIFVKNKEKDTEHIKSNSGGGKSMTMNNTNGTKKHKCTAKHILYSDGSSNNSIDSIDNTNEEYCNLYKSISIENTKKEKTKTNKTKTKTIMILNTIRHSLKEDIKNLELITKSL